jgi:hypothetical protein
MFPSSRGRSRCLRRGRHARREALLAIHAGLAFETVFSPRGNVDFVRRAKDAGYFVRVFVIGTKGPSNNRAHSMSTTRALTPALRAKAHFAPLQGMGERPRGYDFTPRARGAIL